jgi:hypothetical protein
MSSTPLFLLGSKAAAFAKDTIAFDKAGVVTKHTMSTSHEQVKRGG